MKPPCYDRRTNTDCVDREIGCSASCEKWAAYKAEKNKEYAAKARERFANEVYYEEVARMMKRRSKKLWHTGSNYKKEG